MSHRSFGLSFLTVWLSLAASSRGADATPPDYQTQIAPMLAKYCAGCHNPDDAGGDLSVESFAALQQGGESGLAILPGDSRSSRLMRLVRGDGEPKMPPEDEPVPTAAEIDLLAAWIDAGAKGPDGAEPDRTILRTPKLPPPADLTSPVTAVAWSPDGQCSAVARFGTVELLDTQTWQLSQRFEGLPGKVNSVQFCPDGKHVVAATGVAGLYGQATIWDLEGNIAAGPFNGHRDVLYAASLSPDGKILATAGYDQKIVLWDVASAEPLRTLDGHNGAVYDLAFSPDGSILASASGDETIKLWQVSSGVRLDTLGQPLAEQYTVTFSPDGRHVVAGGADNRIRVWHVVSRNKPRINPIRYARFAHEGAVVKLLFTADAQRLVSIAEDRTVKLWETNGFTEVHALEQQPDVAYAAAISPDSGTLLLGRMDGSLARYSLNPGEETGSERKLPADSKTPVTESLMPSVTEASLADRQEQEPNASIEQANEFATPVKISGTIDVGPESTASDSDLFRFASQAGQQWLLEVNAARSGSLLDSRIEVLDEEGRRIPRVLLEAVRDSYLTFRGKDSNTVDDFRVHNWQEMELDEYLYANGEVVRLWLYPRGPDSGFKVYPGAGQRHTFFDTTPVTHALHEPCYIVRPHPPGTQLIPNGLPTFVLDYENDDDGKRQLGNDSRLTFTAPYDGNFFVRISDTRGFSGPDLKYDLTIRPRRPDFSVKLSGANPSVPPGSGREFSVEAERIDGFDGPIRIDIDNLPPGFHVTTPLVIEAGQQRAMGAIHADADAIAPSDENAAITQVTATAEIEGMEVSKEVNDLGTIKLGETPKLRVFIVPIDHQGPVAANPAMPVELSVAAGSTIEAKVVVQRNGFDGLISFGKEDAGRNLPFGTFVDNIGLNGLLVLEGKEERNFFITAAKWLPETTCVFHLKADTDGGQASWPVLLRVVKSGD